MEINKDIITQVETLLLDGKKIPKNINFLYRNIPGTLNREVNFVRDNESIQKLLCYTKDVCKYVEDMLNITLSDIESNFLKSSVYKNETIHTDYEKLSNIIDKNIRLDVVNMLVLYISMFQNQRCVIIGFSKNKINEFKELYKSIPYEYKIPINSFGSNIDFCNGGTIRCSSNSFGSNYDTNVINDSCTYNNIIYNDIVYTLPAYKKKKVIITTTPNGFNTFYGTYLERNS